MALKSIYIFLFKIGIDAQYLSNLCLYESRVKFSAIKYILI